MATSPLPILLLFLLAVTASARPCKTLFFFTTTTTYYPNDYPSARNPNSPNFIQIQNPSDLTLIFTATRFPNHHTPLNFNPHPTIDDDSISSSSSSSDFPLNLYSSVSSSIRDRTKDIMSVVGALLFGVGCGAITAAVMYFLWALFAPRNFDFDEVSSSSSDDDDDVTSIKKKLGYVAIPFDPKMVDGDDLKKPAPLAEEVV